MLFGTSITKTQFIQELPNDENNKVTTIHRILCPACGLLNMTMISEREDCGEVILDAELYTICSRSK